MSSEEIEREGQKENDRFQPRLGDCVTSVGKLMQSAGQVVEVVVLYMYPDIIQCRGKKQALMGVDSRLGVEAVLNVTEVGTFVINSVERAVDKPQSARIWSNATSACARASTPCGA